jgi:hypothetical protein
MSSTGHRCPYRAGDAPAHLVLRRGERAKRRAEHLRKLLDQRGEHREETRGEMH